MQEETRVIKEVLVVEGKMDVAAINKAVRADCIITGGFTLSPRTLANIKAAYEKRGIIILTDPDSAGERIRRFLTERFPLAKHAFIPRAEATAQGDIGVEQAKPSAIRTALAKVRTQDLTPTGTFTVADLIAGGLSGDDQAAERRAQVGAKLGIGFANAKTFLRRLNTYGISRDEFTAATRGK